MRWNLHTRPLFKGKSLPIMFFILPIFIWWGYREMQNQFSIPQAVLVLGGSSKRLEREKFAANFAKKYPNIPIWITGGSPPDYTKKVFAKAGVNLSRLHLDYEAVDTVTNFTTIVDDLQDKKIKSVYLITSDFHMRRARVVGEIILGTRDISLKPISVPSRTDPEPIEKVVRDGFRAIVWVGTGYTGAEGVNFK